MLRALALLHLHDGRTVAEVAALVLMGEKTVRKLRRAFRERGLEALDREPQPPRSARQVCQIVFECVGVAYSQRRRIHVLSALNVENGDFSAKEVPTVDGARVITFLAQLARARPDLKRVHVVLDNAGYNHSHLTKYVERLPGAGRRLHFLPHYTPPHLNPIERPWGVLHQWITHNRWHPSFT